MNCVVQEQRTRTGSARAVVQEEGECCNFKWDGHKRPHQVPWTKTRGRREAGHVGILGESVPGRVNSKNKDPSRNLPGMTGTERKGEVTELSKRPGHGEPCTSLQ